MIILGLLIAINWCISNLGFLLSAWYPSHPVVDTRELSSQNLDLLLFVILIGNIINYIVPLVTGLDPETCRGLVYGLVVLLQYLVMFWFQTQSAINRGELSVGDQEALEVYHGLVENTIIELGNLINSLIPFF